MGPLGSEEGGEREVVQGEVEGVQGRVACAWWGRGAGQRTCAFGVPLGLVRVCGVRASCWLGVGWGLAAGWRE